MAGMSFRMSPPPSVLAVGREAGQRPGIVGCQCAQVALGGGGRRWDRCAGTIRRRLPKSPVM